MAVVGVSFALGPRTADGPVICPFRLLCGFPCPGCGLTRAFGAIARGDLWQATLHNALGVPLFTLLLAASLVWAFEILSGRPLDLPQRWWNRRVQYTTLWTILAYHVARTLWMWRSGILFEEYISRAWWFHLATHSTGF